MPSLVLHVIRFSDKSHRRHIQHRQYSGKYFYPQERLYVRKIWIKCEYMVNEAIKTTWDVPDSLCPPVTHTQISHKYLWWGKIFHIKVFFMIQHLFPVSTWAIFACVDVCVCVESEANLIIRLYHQECIVVSRKGICVCVCVRMSNKFQSYQICVSFLNLNEER